MHLPVFLNVNHLWLSVKRVRVREEGDTARSERLQWGDIKSPFLPFVVIFITQNRKMK